jgi:hypothetical protein
MTLLYKKADWLWRLLVPLRLTHAAWHPLVELHRRLAWRRLPVGGRDGCDRLEGVAPILRAA